MNRNTMDYDSEVAAGSGFVAGVLLGAAVGAAAALLFAPRRGAELRGQIADSAADISRRARENYDRARDAYDRTSDTVSDIAERASGWVGDVKSTMRQKTAEASNRVNTAVS